MVTVPAIVSRETSVLRPWPTMVGWGLSVQNPEDAGIIPPASSMNLYGANQGFYEIETGFYSIGVRFYEIDE